MINAAPLAFDASTLEVWCPLLTGGLISCWEGRGADLVGIAERVNRDKVNAAWLTSALFQAAVDGVPTFFESIQIVNTGGDVVSAEHVRRIQARYTGLVVVNGYGPTENTVCTTAEVIGPGSLQGKDSVLIGRPIFGTTVSILDQDGRRVPIGKAGELVAGGDGVAQGYVGVSNDDRFFVEDGKRYYRTGDLARWTFDGRLEFHGRRDGQVKISGNRIEFGAIEAALRMCPGVADACVSSIGEGARRKLIAAIAGDDSSISIAEVRNSLENRVSAAEVPSTIVAVPVIPVTSNGKPDRRAVTELVQAVPETRSVAKGDDELVEIVMDVIKETLEHAPSTPTEKLIDVGIDSLDMVRITLALGDRLARPVELGEVIQGGDVAGIAARIRSDISREAENIVALRGSSNPDRSAVYCIPGVGGTVFSYGSLLDAIDSDIPVFGLPYPGLSGGQEPLDSVDALADRFANLIVNDRSAQVIVGYSLGGFIAFETARRVHELTGVAPSVLVIDAAPTLLPLWQGLRSRKAIRMELRIRLESVLPPGVVGLLRGRRKVTTLASLRSVVAAGFRAVRTYNPKHAALDVLLLRTSETKFGDGEKTEDLGWNRIAAKIRIKEIEGRHLDVFRGSTGMDIGMAITEEYNRAGRLEIQRRQAFRSSRG
jgi:thioesterase domain-containing protein/acyl carrier protein